MIGLTLDVVDPVELATRIHHHLDVHPLFWDLKLIDKPGVNSGVFFPDFQKTQGKFSITQGQFSSELKDFSHNSRNFRHNSTIFVKIPRNFTQNSKQIPITQGIFANNSIFRKIHLRRLPGNPGKKP